MGPRPQPGGLPLGVEAPLRIFALASAVPFRGSTDRGTTAVHIVAYELIAALRGMGHDLTLQILLDRPSPTLSPAEEDERGHLERLGVTVLPPLSCALVPPPRSRLDRVTAALGAGGSTTPGIAEFYPAVGLRAEVERRLRARGADAVLTLWSPEGIAATHGLRGCPRVAFHGDVDYVPREVRLQDRELFGIGPAGWLGGWQESASLDRFRRAHHALMRDVTVIANVTATNAPVYTAQGHPASLYVGNTWTNVGGPAPTEVNRTGTRPARILGHVGGLGQTGSTYGLHFLLAEVMPHLPEVLRGVDYEVHLVGGGDVVPGLRGLLDQPRLVRRGYVEDIDAEMREADVLLLLNNAGRYLAAYTRHVIAWSMGMCLVAHANSRGPLPELVPGENALAGASGREVAEAVKAAITDRELARRIREAGRATYERTFAPAVVAARLVREMRAAVSTSGVHAGTASR